MPNTLADKGFVSKAANHVEMCVRHRLAADRMDVPADGKSLWLVPIQNVFRLEQERMRGSPLVIIKLERCFHMPKGDHHDGVAQHWIMRFYQIAVIILRNDLSFEQLAL